jgi:cob(I)alamin adenosyltransferase
VSHIARMKIYTKTGDEGTSSLYSGARRQKDDAIFHALGDVDELNSAVGLSRDLLTDLDSKTAEQVMARQSDADEVFTLCLARLRST